MRRWDGLVDRYIEEYAARGISTATVGNVRRELDRWGTWMKRRRPRPVLEAIDSDLLITYLRVRSRFRAKATLCGVLTAMRGLGDYLVAQQVWSSSPLRWIRGPKLDWRSHLPRRIGAESMSQLFKAASDSRQGYHRWLWATVLSVLYGTGLRRGELERLDVGDWQRDSGFLLIDGRKTGQERQVAVPELTARLIESYLPHRHNHLERQGAASQAALFVNKSGGRLRGHAVSRAVGALAVRGGVGRITLHQFRHSCASDLLEDGVHVADVQRILGHQTITTTVRYLHIADPQRHQAVGRHPINQMLNAEVNHEAG
jgi:site-specific recombinase XerD